MRYAIFAIAGIACIAYALYAGLILLASVIDVPWASLEREQTILAVIQCSWPLVLAVLGLVFLRQSRTRTTEGVPSERDIVVGGLQLIGWSCLIVALFDCFTGLSFLFTLASARELTLHAVLRQGLPVVALAAMGWLCIWQRERMYRIVHRSA